MQTRPAWTAMRWLWPECGEGSAAWNGAVLKQISGEGIMNSGIKTFRYRRLALSVIIGAACHATVNADTLDEWRAALEGTKPIVDFRVRVESVDQTPIAEESEVTTLRVRLGFETGKAFQ